MVPPWASLGRTVHRNTDTGWVWLTGGAPGASDQVAQHVGPDGQTRSPHQSDALPSRVPNVRSNVMGVGDRPRPRVRYVVDILGPLGRERRDNYVKDASEPADV